MIQTIQPPEIMLLLTRGTRITIDHSGIFLKLHSGAIAVIDQTYGGEDVIGLKTDRMKLTEPPLTAPDYISLIAKLDKHEEQTELEHKHRHGTSNL